MSWWLLLACVHKVQITSYPAGAVLFLDGERLGSLPQQLELRPLERPRLSVSLPGYRTVTFRPDLNLVGWDFIEEAFSFRWGKATGRKPWGSLEVLLLENHPTYGGLAPESTE